MPGLAAARHTSGISATPRPARRIFASSSADRITAPPGALGVTYRASSERTAYFGSRLGATTGPTTPRGPAPPAGGAGAGAGGVEKGFDGAFGPGDGRVHGGAHRPAGGGDAGDRGRNGGGECVRIDGG